MEQYNELYHYGVKGMKWGIRRYQNADGSLTAEGRKRAKQEYKNDNKLAYELGKKATIYGHAAAKSLKRTTKLENKLAKRYDKDSSGTSRRTQVLKRKMDASFKTTEELSDIYQKMEKAAKLHCDSLIDKYGKEAVSEIKYTNKKVGNKAAPETFRTMNEKTNDLSDYASAGVMTLGTTAMLTMMGTPFAMIYTPKSTGQKAAELESMLYYNNREAQRK